MQKCNSGAHFRQKCNLWDAIPSKMRAAGAHFCRKCAYKVAFLTKMRARVAFLHFSRLGTRIFNSCLFHRLSRVSLFISPRLEFHTSLRGVHPPDHEPEVCLRVAYAQLTLSLHATCTQRARQACRATAYANAYAQLTRNEMSLTHGSGPGCLRASLRVAYA